MITLFLTQPSKWKVRYLRLNYSQHERVVGVKKQFTQLMNSKTKFAGLNEQYHTDFIHPRTCLLLIFFFYGNSAMFVLVTLKSQV